MATIDLNSDVGESFGSWQLPDEQMLDVVSSANIACGFHAGDPVTMHRTVARAVEQGVAIGAHVGYRDLHGFGRRAIAYTAEDLTAEVLYQIAALDGIARTAGTRVSYVKPHGALYNTIVTDAEQARAVVDAVAAYDRELSLLLLPGSEAMRYARSVGLPVVGEAFADRAYHPDGTLVSRREPGAVLHDVDQVVANMLRFCTDRVIIARDGTEVPTEAASICTHGDTPGAAQMAQALREALTAAGVKIRPFALG
ncbi:LamB/YcsF family protein [Nesterenkonia alba]|uniref:LamB/YcsF family protein n=1 Tax=Nesterenkonia alba TaxID=515814 RepID=UPI0003B55134|nr:5-oxoprolinase subunit PxpA [Nesterenkonia alba]